MRRWPVIAVTWALGTSTGVLLGLFGVQLVASGITDSLVSPLSRPEVLRALQAEAAPEPAPPVQPPADPPPSPLPDPGAVPPLTTPVSPPAPTPPASSPPRPGAVAGTTTTAPPPPPTTAPPATAPPAPAPAPPTGVTRTITSAGGTVAVRYESGRVRLLWARPNDGFDVEVEKDGPEVVEVEFRGKGHRSLVRAFYEDGAPAQDVVEQGRPPGRGDDGKDG